jgi:hypothetical protein
MASSRRDQEAQEFLVPHGKVRLNQFYIFSKRIPNMPKSKQMEERCGYHGRHKLGFALFLLVVGFFWLLKDMGYIPTLPFWPIVTIFFALFLLLSRM